MDDTQVATSETSVSEPQVYKDDDLVYVDPRLRIVVGRVEWSVSGKPKSLQMKDTVEEEGEEEPAKKDVKEKQRRPRRLRNYPWGTYRSMKRLFKLEGKQPKTEANKTLDEVLEKALKEPFWD